MVRKSMLAFPGIYDQFIASLTTADVKTTAKIWYLKLDQNTRKGMLEQFKQFLGSSKSEKVSIKISKGKVSSETIAIEKAKTDNIPYPVSIDQAGELLPVLVDCFNVQHETPNLNDYIMGAL